MKKEFTPQSAIRNYIQSAIRNPQSAIILLSLSLFLLSSLSFADPYDLILCGKGGEKEYEDRFADWGTRLRQVLIRKLGHPAQNVTLFIESKVAPRLAGAGVSNLETITGTLQKLAPRLKPGDTLFIYLIGHGSFQNGEAKFNIDGPDLSAANLKTLLSRLPAGELVVIDASSSSAGFINALSAPRRAIVTATKSIDERNATEFMESFIQGLEDASADQNRDGRISLLEACQQAAALTQAGYTGKGLILTEHALLDDDGDGLGTRLPLDAAATTASRTAAKPQDGARAATLYLKDFIFPATVPPELVRDYRAALADIDALKTRKAKLKTADYTAQLETLLLKAARINREIHRRAP